MEKQILQTLEFQTVFNPNAHELPGKPTMPSEEIRSLRQSLIDEEVEELANAKTIEDVADAIIDSMYILIGTAHEYGIADRLVDLFDEVHKSNMSKVTEDGTIKYREDGKVLKPETFTPPNLKEILDRDFSIYRAFREEAQAIEVRDKILLEQLVLKNIRRRLKPDDLGLLEDYLKKERQLKKVFDVAYLGGGINERYCELTVYGETVEIKVDWSKEHKKYVKKALAEQAKQNEEEQSSK